MAGGQSVQPGRKRDVVADGSGEREEAIVGEQAGENGHDHAGATVDDDLRARAIPLTIRMAEGGFTPKYEMGAYKPTPGVEVSVKVDRLPLKVPPVDGCVGVSAEVHRDPRAGFGDRTMTGTRPARKAGRGKGGA